MGKEVLPALRALSGASAHGREPSCTALRGGLPSASHHLAGGGQEVVGRPPQSAPQLTRQQPPREPGQLLPGRPWSLLCSLRCWAASWAAGRSAKPRAGPTPAATTGHPWVQVRWDVASDEAGQSRPRGPARAQQTVGTGPAGRLRGPRASGWCTEVREGSPAPVTWCSGQMLPAVHAHPLLRTITVGMLVTCGCDNQPPPTG